MPSPLLLTQKIMDCNKKNNLMETAEDINLLLDAQDQAILTKYLHNLSQKCFNLLLVQL